MISAGGAGIGSIVAGRALREGTHRRLASWLRFSGPVSLVGMVAFMATSNGDDAGANVGYAGIVERTLVTVMMLSMAAIGLSAARSSGSERTDGELERPSDPLAPVSRREPW